MKQLPKHWIVMDSAKDIAEVALAKILDVAQEAIQKRRIFKIVLAGGTTPENVYRLLAKESCDWQHWHFYLGDERCLPADHTDRNSQMALKTLLNHIEIPEDNIHFIAAELGAEQAAKRYEKTVIKDALPFDLVLLGMGEDGHTASLFPGHQHPKSELVHAVYNAPKPPPERVSLSVNALSENHNLMILVTGKSKKESVAAWLKGRALPVSSISSLGVTTVLLDKLALADTSAYK